MTHTMDVNVRSATTDRLVPAVKAQAVCASLGNVFLRHVHLRERVWAVHVKAAIALVSTRPARIHASMLLTESGATPVPQTNVSALSILVYRCLVVLRQITLLARRPYLSAHQYLRRLLLR